MKYTLKQLRYWIQATRHGISVGTISFTAAQRYAFIKQFGVGNKKKTTAEWVIEAQAIAAAHGGVLPIMSHLNSSLRASIRTHSLAFSHIKRTPKAVGKSIDEHVKEAKRLCKANGGRLPRTKWLLENGYQTLLSAKWKYPKAFAAMKQEGIVGASVLTYKQARCAVHKAGITTVAEYRRAASLPEGLTTKPERTYSKEWSGWKEFLGTQKEG